MWGFDIGRIALVLFIAVAITSIDLGKSRRSSRSSRSSRTRVNSYRRTTTTTAKPSIPKTVTSITSQDRIYWTSFNEDLSRPQINSLNMSAVITVAKMKTQTKLVSKTIVSPYGNTDFVKLASDVKDDAIFWTSNDHSRIFFVDGLTRLKGTTKANELLIRTSHLTPGLTYDWVHRNLYWSDLGHGQIAMAPGQAFEMRRSVLLTGIHPYGVSVHPTKCYIFWSDNKANTIERASLSGENRKQLVITDLLRPGTIHVDVHADQVYFIDFATYKIERTDLNGGRRELINQVMADGTMFSGHMGMAIYQSYLICTSETTPFLYLVPKEKDALGRRRFLTAPLSTDGHRDIEIMASSEQPPETTLCSEAKCDHMCVGTVINNTAGFKCICSQGFVLDKDGKTCLNPIDKDFLVIITKLPFTVYLYDLMNQQSIPIPIKFGRSNVNNPVAVVYDPTERRIIWTDLQQRKIMSANLQGEDIQIIMDFKSQRMVQDGMALEDSKRNLYVTDSVQSLILRITLTAVRKSLAFKVAGGKPRAIALDTANRNMYWTDWGSRPRIERSNMDTGGNRQTLISSNIRCPNGLALDTIARKMFWVDCTIETLEMANLDGSGRRRLFQEPEASYFGLVIDRRFVYFTDWSSNYIKRYDRIAGNMNTTWAQLDNAGLSGIAIHRSHNPLPEEVTTTEEMTSQAITTTSPKPSTKPTTTTTKSSTSTISTRTTTTKTTSPTTSTTTTRLAPSPSTTSTTTTTTRPPATSTKKTTTALSIRPTPSAETTASQGIQGDRGVQVGGDTNKHQDAIDRLTAKHTRMVTSISCGVVGGSLLIVIIVVAVAVTKIRKRKRNDAALFNRTRRISRSDLISEAPPAYDDTYATVAPPISAAPPMAAGGFDNPVHLAKEAEANAQGQHPGFAEQAGELPPKEGAEYANLQQCCPPEYEKEAPAYATLTNVVGTNGDGFIVDSKM